jgi:23S rRNA pseudouridine1911/1915/1917 synthase
MPLKSDRPAATVIPEGEPTLLLEDGPLLAINKPAGLLTQGVPDGLPSLEAWVKDYLKRRYNKPGNVYLGVPHRLDRPVSGVVVFARNSKAAARLAEQFRDRAVRKWYLAVTAAIPVPPEGMLADWLLKDPQRAQVTVVGAGTPGAREAVLRYAVLATQAQTALVQVELLTGRMHQIRVQFASRGWPLLGDVQYGGSALDIASTAIALHAEQLELRHPIRYDTIRLRAPLPARWLQYGFSEADVCRLPRPL